MPPGPDAKIEPPVREHIDGAGHFREQSWIAIANAGDQLPNTHAPGVASQRRRSGPGLKGTS